jgi:nitrate reductase assembly molybdenum cofactor insertion protein NarJ
MSYAHYCSLAELFDFPQPRFAARGRAVATALREGYPDAAIELDQFVDALPDQTLDQQELHTRTFDVQSMTTLDVGYVLFGDDYKRGALLSKLNQEHTRAGNDCGGELADHLPNVLRLMPKLDDPQIRLELVEHILIPALLLMIRDFEPARIAKKNAHYQKHFSTLIDPARGGDPAIYCHALNAVMGVLVKDFDMSATIARLADWSTRRQTVDFLKRVENELDIERDANPVNSGCDA